MTQVQRVQQHVKKVQAHVSDLTGFDMDDLNKMLFEGAYKFLEMIGCTGDNATLMASTPQFWNYWRKQWCEIDEQFLNKYKTLHMPDVDYSAIGVIEDPETNAMQTVRDYKALRMWYSAYHECKITNKCLNSTLVYSTFKMKDLTKSTK